MINQEPTKGRLMARVLRDLLDDQQFETLSDLVETWKRRCVRLKIAWSNDAVNDALRVVGSNVELTRARLLELPPMFDDGPRPVTRADVAVITQRIHDRLGLRAESPRGPEWPEYFPDLVRVHQ